MNQKTRASFRSRNLLSDPDRAGRVALDMINQQNFGQAVIGSRRQNLFINDAARAIIKRSKILELRRNKIWFLPAATEVWVSRQFRECNPDNQIICRTDGALKLIIAIRRLPEMLFADDGPTFVMSLNHSQISAELVTKKFADLFTLTPREAEVSGLLTEGQTVIEIARLLEVKESTIRSHIKKIFQKTGVNQQTDLVRLGMLLGYQ